jgi:hypothetical protein
MLRAEALELIVQERVQARTVDGGRLRAEVLRIRGWHEQHHLAATTFIPPALVPITGQSRA